MKKIEELPKVDLTALAHSYADACANKDFKKFVDGLNCNDDSLMKYTSNLEDSFVEFQNCKSCFLWVSVPLLTLKILPPPPGGTFPLPDHSGEYDSQILEAQTETST